MKQTLVFILIISFLFAMNIFFYQKFKMVQKESEAKDTVISSQNLSISEFKNNEIKQLENIKEKEAENKTALKERQVLDEAIGNNSNNKEWLDAPIPADIIKLLHDKDNLR